MVTARFAWLSYSPLKYRRMAIFKKSPSLIDEIISLQAERISQSKHEITKAVDFKRKIYYGYDGYLFYDTNENAVGYYWYTINQPPPTSIPKIPKSSVWIFNMLVFDEFRGNGYQREMLKHFDRTFRQYESLYADILFNNIASIKNFLKVGYKENGVYWIVILGIRRYKNLNLKFGRWNQNKKHDYNFLNG